MKKNITTKKNFSFGRQYEHNISDLIQQYFIPSQVSRIGRKETWLCVLDLLSDIYFEFFEV